MTPGQGLRYASFENTAVSEGVADSQEPTTLHSGSTDAYFHGAYPVPVTRTVEHAPAGNYSDEEDILPPAPKGTPLLDSPIYNGLEREYGTALELRQPGHVEQFEVEPTAASPDKLEPAVIGGIAAHGVFGQSPLPERPQIELRYHDEHFTAPAPPELPFGTEQFEAMAKDPAWAWLLASSTDPRRNSPDLTRTAELPIQPPQHHNEALLTGRWKIPYLATH